MKIGTWSIVKEIFIRALWFPALVFVAHLVLYFVFGVYRKVPGLDMLTHCLGGIAIAFFFSVTITILSRRGVLSGMDGIVRSVLIFALTATVAMFWEFGEYVFDSYFSTRIQAGLEDTLSDMAFGVLGGLIFLLLQRFWRTLS